MGILRSFARTSVVLGLLIAGATSAIAQDPIALYATDGRSCSPSTLYQLDPADGSIISTIGSTGVSGMTSLAFHPVTGVMYGITTGGNGCNSNLYTVDLATGVATLVGPTGIPRGKPDATFRADGTMFTYSTNDNYLYTVNLNTGALSPIGNTTVGAWDISLTFEDGTLVMTDGDTIYTVDTTTGLASSVTSLGTGVNDSSMSTTHPVTGQVYLGDSDNYSQFDLYTLNTSTGDMVLLGSNSVDRMSAIEFSSEADATSTPIPTMANWSMLLMVLLLGLFGMVYYRARTN